MADSANHERLQPSLLDRLTDDQPEKREESRERRVLSLRRLRAAVLRDLGWLLNTPNLATTEDLEDYPFVERSVLNFGVRDLTGKVSSSVGVTEVEREMRQAITDFEPRILRNSLQVTVLADATAMNPTAVAFRIEGDLWAKPMSERLFMRTEVDLDTGAAAVGFQDGRGRD